MREDAQFVEIVEVVNVDKMKKFIYITADMNDGDYISELTEISEERFELIAPVIDAIVHCPYKTNYPTGYFRAGTLYNQTAEKLYGHLQGFEFFDELRPVSEYGIHTINEIKVLEVTNIKELL